MEPYRLNKEELLSSAKVDFMSKSRHTGYNMGENHG